MAAGTLVRRALIAGAGAGWAACAGSPAVAADAADAAANSIDEIVVEGKYRTQKLASDKYTLPLIDTPQTVSVIADDLLNEQGRRTLRDSLRNITGISIQAGEGNPPGGGDAASIRGFAARDDIYVDGVRDPGNYFRDPFNAERVEVTKGPASAFAGRGNIGGTVNIVSRAPVLENSADAEFSLGTDNFYRATGDANYVLSEDKGVALRFNVMGHKADEPGRDVALNKRWGVAPSLAIGLGSPTVFTASYLHQAQDDIPDFGLPNARNFSLAGSGLGGLVAPVDPENFYGYSTDYRDVAVDLVTLSLRHAFSDAAAIATKLRYGRAHNDSIVSAPRFVGNVTTLNAATAAVGNQKPRDQIDEILISQTDLTLGFATGALAHTLVAGAEISFENSENRRRLDANGPAMNLFHPHTPAAAPIAHNGTRALLETDTVSFYAFDTIEFSEQWLVTGGLRYDMVDTRIRGFDDDGIAPGFVADLEAEDDELSWNAALVFKPTARSSLYVAYGTAFETSGRAEVVQLAGGNNAPPATAASFDVDPERSRAIEAGAKHEALGGRLALAAALFQIDKTNARTPGVNPGDPAVVLDGEQRVRGVEFSAVGALTDAWSVFAGYSYLDGEVTQSNTAFEIGQQLDHTPEHSLSIWTSYALTEDFLAGGGVQFASERASNISSSPTGNLTVVAPSYAVLDAFVEYRLTDRVLFRLNGYNLADETYFQSFSSGQSIPSAGRSGVLTIGVSL